MSSSLTASLSAGLDVESGGRATTVPATGISKKKLLAILSGVAVVSLFLGVGIALASVSGRLRHPRAEWDLLLFGGSVYDGSGLPPFAADVAIRDGRIVQVGAGLDQRLAAETVNVTGLCVAPGFIDAHTHSDIRLAFDITGDSRLRDGITTEIGGLCGQSLAPCLDAGCIKWRSEELWAAVPDTVLSQIGTFESEVKWFNENKPSTNLMLFAGHNTIRSATCGAAATCEPAQLERAKELLRQAMLEGAWGLATGLSYTPGVFAPTEELVELNKVVASLGGYHLTHMRNEDRTVLESIEETISVAKQADVKTTISHLKIMNKNMNNKSEPLFSLIDSAVSDGVDIWADQYPYAAIGADLHYGMPKWLSALPVDERIAALNNATILSDLRAFIDSGEMFNNLGLTGWSDVWPSTTGNPNWDGKSIPDIAAQLGKTEFDTWIYLMIDCRFRCMAVYFNMDDGIVESIMRHPRVMLGSDGSSIRLGGPLNPGHPRWLGSASRVLGHYARDKKLFSLEWAVHRMTGMPAQRYGLADRGRISTGAVADITVFDPATVIDKSTFVESKQYSAGIVHVLVNGTFAVHNSNTTGVRSGQIILGPAFAGSSSSV